MIRFQCSTAIVCIDHASRSRVRLACTVVGAALVCWSTHPTTLAADGPVRARKPVSRVDQFGDPLPKGAIARLGSTRFRHGQLGITCIKYSPNGKVVASGGVDTTIRLWHANTGRVLMILHGHRVAPIGLSFSPNGQRLVSCDEFGQAFCWNVLTGRKRELVPESRSVRTVYFLADNESIAVADSRKGIRIINSQNGKEVKRLHFSDAKHGVTCLHILRGSKLLVVATNGHQVGICSFKTSKFETKWNLRKQCNSVAFLADGDRIIVHYRNQIEVRDAATGRVLNAFPASTFTRGSDGDHFYSVENGELILRDCDGKLQRKVLDRPVLDHIGCMTASPQGDFIATAGSVIRVRNLRTGQDVVPASVFAPGSAVQFTSDGAELNTGHSLWNAISGDLIAVGAIKFRNTRNAKVRFGTAFRGRPFLDGSIFAGPDKKYADIRVDNETLTLYRLRSQKRLWSYTPGLGKRALIHTVQHTRDGKHVVVTYTTRFRQPRLSIVLSTSTGRVIARHRLGGVPEIGPTGKRLYFVDPANRAIVVRQIDAPAQSHTLEWPVVNDIVDSSPIQSNFRFSADARTVLFCSISGNLCIWDSRSRRSLFYQKVPRDGGFALSPDGSLVTLVDKRAQAQSRISRYVAKVHSLRDRAVKPIFLSAMDYGVPNLRFSPNSRYLVMAQTRLYLYDLKTQKAIIKPVQSPASVTIQPNAIGISPNSRYLAAATANGRIVLWSIPESNAIAVLDASAQLVEGLQFSPDNGRIVALLKNQCSLLYSTGLVRTQRQ